MAELLNPNEIFATAFEPKVKNRFLEYYNLAIKNYDFYLLVDETKKFNAFLDKNI